MSDIILFIIFISLLLIYMSFLTYEWIRNKKEKFVKAKYNFVVPAAYKIYCIMQKKIKIELKEEILDRYRKLHVGKNEEEIKKEFFMKHISLFLYACLAFHFIVLFTLLSCQSERYIVSEYYIEKNDIGGVQKEINVNTDIGGLKKETEITIPERKYNEKEILVQAKNVKKYIYSCYLGNNKSAENVKTNLLLVKKINGSMFNISWISSNENIVTIDGKVECKKIDEPENVELTAVLKYEQYKEKIKFNITVMPVKMTNEDIVWEKWKKKLDTAIEETKSFKYIKLPDKVDGKKVKYSINKYNRLWQTIGIVALMFIIIPFMAERIVINKVSEREKQLKLAFPEMIEKFILLINAGMPVKSAWIRIAETQSNKNDKVDYLKEEMLFTKNQMENGLNEEKAYEMFGRRIGILNYMKFCTLLVQNLKKGTADLIRILEYESADIFNERKENAKILGEEASTKLLIPMVMMMVIIFAIILYAAFAGM